MTNSPDPSIEAVGPEQQSHILPDLIKLLQDSVAGDASIGFVVIPNDEEAAAYWYGVFDGVVQQTRVLLVARDAGSIIGAVQLDLAVKPNAHHRTELQKLLVLQCERRRGIGRQLMAAAEQAALERSRPLLVLDTVQGGVAEQMYRRLGYIEAGCIPAYAQSTMGAFETTVIFYKLLAQPV